MNRRLPHTPAAGSTSGRYSEPAKPACAGIARPGKPTPFDLLHDYISGPIHERAKAEAEALCSTCPLYAAGCWDDPANEAWVKSIRGRRSGPKGGAPRGPIPDCGTNRKYWWHRRNGEPACDPCREANNAYKRKQRAEKMTEPRLRALEAGRAAHSVKTARANAARADELRHFVASGIGLTEVCQALDVKRGALQKWCSRHGLTDVYLALGAIERRASNQHARGAA